MTLSGATPPDQSEPGSNSNEGVLSITGASPSDCFMSYQGHLLRESYFSAEIQLLYSTAPVDWAETFGDRFKGSNYNWYDCHLHVTQLF